MSDRELNNFLRKLSSSFLLFAPQADQGGLKIKAVRKIEAIDWSGEMPLNTWKNFFLPPRESLFKFENQKIKAIETNYRPTICLGINVLDLKALTLWEQIFSQDVYYQKRRRQLVLIGYSAGLPADYKKYKVFSYQYEEDVLEHLVFDIFIVRLKNHRLKFYSGSEKGQLILEQNGVKDYRHVEFAGPIAEEGPDPRMKLLQKKVEKSRDKKIWDELAKICLACGQCSLVCPTCFCFDFEDKLMAGQERRDRCWGSCFYHDFSLMAGGQKPLKTVKDRLYFWYAHKFIRIPHEYSLPGCVSCGRCSRVCPVGIKINEVIKAL